jgi:copper resistance protein B
MTASTQLPQAMLLSVILCVLVPAAMAQNMPAPAGSASSAMSTVDHGGMQGMDMGDTPASASTSTLAASAPIEPRQAPGSENMRGMHDGSMAPVKTDAMPAIGPAIGMGPMQGGSAPSGARSADYSDGIGYGPMRGMDMRDSAPQSMLLIDQLEAFHGHDANGQTWEGEAWYGNDDNKLWLRTEGERRRGRLDDGDIEALWNHTIAAYWSSQLGIRQDLGEGPDRHWAAFGMQGLSPYWFGLEATGYVSDAGRTAARFRAQYEVLFTQRLILQPELEVNAYGQSDAQWRIGSGLSDAQLGLRLRYEFNRQFAPYVGVVWTRRFGNTADMVRDDHQAIFDRQWVAGIRLWF